MVKVAGGVYRAISLAEGRSWAKVLAVTCKVRKRRANSGEGSPNAAPGNHSGTISGLSLTRGGGAAEQWLNAEGIELFTLKSRGQQSRFYPIPTS